MVYGNQGITHHATEDIAIMRALPGMRVYVPGDAYEAEACLKDAYEYDGPAYIRLARNKEQNFHDATNPIDINKISPLSEAGSDINILTAGSILCEGVKLRNLLNDAGISAGIFSVPRVKPSDKEGIIKLALSSKILLTLEEHQIIGGLGGEVAEVISGIKDPHVLLHRVGLNNQFSDETGDQGYLRDFYGLSAEKLFPVVKDILSGATR